MYTYRINSNLVGVKVIKRANIKRLIATCDIEINLYFLKLSFMISY